MVVEFSYKIISMDKKEIVQGEGHTELNNPIMLYAQIPIEKDQYNKLCDACNEQKISIYDLLIKTVNQDPEEMKFQIF